MDAEDPSENVPENYVSYILKNQKALPPVTWSNWYKELHWLQVGVLVLPPVVAFHGVLSTPLQVKTCIWMFAYGNFLGLMVTAGYHRLWAHRSYKASKVLEYFTAIFGAGAIQGSIAWWARGHRAHHRYTDTDLDPYNAHKGLFYSHMGWLIFKPRRKLGPADVSDLRQNSVVQWQHRYYALLAALTAVVLPTCVAGLLWGDWKGGWAYASFLRIVALHHSTFLINSLCHWMGEKPYDDKLTPGDSFFTALLTMGEGYHNFHHQFPMDYRNGHKWYHYDPTKWLIRAFEKIGLASHLTAVSDNEVQKGELAIQLKHLRERQETLVWPVKKHDLPVITWEEYQRQAESRILICIAGYIHDITTFIDQHPGGPLVLKNHIGKDATTAFFGGVYDHSNAAHNLLAMKRVAILLGGAPHGFEEKVVPPCQHLKIAHFDELADKGYPIPSSPTLS